MEQNSKLEKIVSLCKRRGFVFPDSEIYGGLSGFYSYGHLGNELLHNIKNLWWQKFVYGREDVFGVRTPIVMNPKVWEAAGHVQNFTDPLEGGKFNTMFKTEVGARKDETTTAYLRPETAQGMFANFKTLLDTTRGSLPMGVAQIGKAFRNEISPRDFIFRLREFEQMEIEYFIKPNDWQSIFEQWRVAMHEFFTLLGLPKVHELEVPDGDRAHYSKRTIDFEFEYSIGRREIAGLAYRTDFDLSSHAKYSGADLSFYDEETKERFIPHVIEPSFGVEMILLAILDCAYTEDELGGEKRIYLKLAPKIAPIKVAVFPLLKNKPELVAKAREIYKNLKTYNLSPITCIFDDNGNIGKRYRRQDEIGTPFCVTVDFQTLDDQTITVRHRDSGIQDRLASAELPAFILEKIK